MHVGNMNFPKRKEMVNRVYSENGICSTILSNAAGGFISPNIMVERVVKNK